MSRIRSSPGSACKVIFLLPVWGPKRRSAVKLAVHEAITEYAHEHGDFILDPQIDERQDFYPDQIHITPAAADRIGELIAQFIDDEGLI